MKKKKTSNVDDVEETTLVGNPPIDRSRDKRHRWRIFLKPDFEGNIDVAGLHAITVTCNTRLRRRGEDILR